MPNQCSEHEILDYGDETELLDGGRLISLNRSAAWQRASGWLPGHASSTISWSFPCSFVSQNSLDSILTYRFGYKSVFYIF